MSVQTEDYYMQMTAQQFEEAILSIANKISKNNIITDYTLGGDSNVVAASALKTVLSALVEKVTPDGITALIAEAEDSNVFTDADKATLDSALGLYQGVVSSQVDLNAIDTTNFNGGEMVIYENDQRNITEIRYWDNTSKSWATLDELVSKRINVSIPTINTTVTLLTLNTANYKAIDFTVAAKGSTVYHIQDFRVGIVGTEAQYAPINKICSEDLFTINFVVSGTSFSIQLTSVYGDIDVQFIPKLIL